MSDFELPEIRRVDSFATVLSLHAWGKPDPREFGWFEPPTDHALESAERLLAMLGALSSETNGTITQIGRRILELPVHPRLGCLLIAAAGQNLLDEGAAIAALLSEKDIVRSTFDRDQMYRPATQSNSDLLIRLDLLHQAEQDRFGARARSLEIDLGVARQVARVRDELLRIGQRIDRRAPRSDQRRHPNEPPDEQTLLRLPLLAYPDRVARRRGADPTSAIMVGGSGVRLGQESSVTAAEFFVALDAREDQRRTAREAIVRIASAIDVAWLEDLFPSSIRRERIVTWDEERQRVSGVAKTWYYDLLLREDRNIAVNADEAEEAFAAAVKDRAAQIIAADEEASHWLARLEFLRQSMPEHPWPKADPQELGELLASASRGKRSLEELRPVPLVPLLQSLLIYPLDRMMEREAPQSIEVPTGNQIRLRYDQGARPVLAVRLQELFGMLDTPRIAGGRVPVLLHLLGPNYRPVQITDDLRSFWTTTYFQVRKDLRTRYPKHSWPEDPLTAKPEAKGSRRRAAN